MTIKITSFSYKHGKPPEGAVVFDCRHLPNPYHLFWARVIDGTAARLQEWLCGMDPDGVRQVLIEASLAANKEKSLAFGCVGGKHRSVAVAEMTARMLKAAGHEVEVEHTELKTENNT